jgi:hypothetical protein
MIPIPQKIREPTDVFVLLAELDQPPLDPQIGGPSPHKNSVADPLNRLRLESIGEARDDLEAPESLDPTIDFLHGNPDFVTKSCGIKMPPRK